MFPVLLDFGVHNLPFFGETHLFIPTYGVLYACGAVIAWIWLMRRARTLKVPDEHMFNLCFYGLLAGLLGAKLFLILVEWRYYLNNPMEILGTIRSAGVLIGGVIAGAAVFIWYCRRHNLPTLTLADAFVAPLAVGQAVGRLGCFSAGCCYGSPTEGPLSVTFTDPVAAAQTGVPLNIPLIPTQLTELTTDLLLAILLTFLWRKRVSPPGTVLWTYVLVYSCLRFLIEFGRGDDVRGLWFGGALSTSQILALVAGLAAAAMLLRGRKQRALELNNG